ncbi:hypothetical protein E8K88_04235 [Lampropedia aestuarii]|uniref:DUF4124 domain-containing protein n=1 Tax=Lampropedia aestuarii TaxID=2562762 RepID=A0A4S5BV45_9BURK|nr:hypothetical protein [Lampropedia aestuarii]MDH5857531.1 hypothetical protein [Lampropedia aestuarii]THJ35213.1 hypothetical protein E8K88_04235 [Lampropedia aestuarii]
MKKLIAIAALAAATFVSAQPSMYYWFVNEKTGEKVCESELPGADWKKVDETIYQDFECKNKL